MNRIPDSAWQKFSTILTDFLDESGKKVITWKRAITQPMAFGEDSDEAFYPDILLEVLVGGNYARQWPINKGTISGELDNQNCTLWVSSNKLLELGYLNADGYWDFDRTLDRFIIDGITYKTSGDTTLAQAKDKTLLFMVVLKREEVSNEGNEVITVVP